MASKPLPRPRQNRVTAPELRRFVVNNVCATGVNIGVGGYGSVEEVEIPGALVAAKKLHSQLVALGSPEQVLKWISDFVAECKLMSQLRHPHIVQFLGVCYLRGSRLPVLLMEKLQTSLDNLLETNPDIPLDIKVFLLTGTGRGVVFLHSRSPSIAHRDLTARNVLIDSGLTAKIADLGMAKMVNIQPGQLATTMTRAPGNVLYMPPEAVQEERATRYNTAIDIFSFGVISLFTLTQTFPKDLKAAAYQDPVTRRLVARSEIERREEYIQLMTTALGETNPLVQLTKNCLEFDPQLRPSAVEVLRRLEEVGRTIPQNFTETKLELIGQISRKEEEIHQLQSEHLRQLTERNAEKQAQVTQIDQLQAEVTTSQAQIAHLQADNNRLLADKQDQLQLTAFKEQQLQIQRREIDRLSGQLRSLKLQIPSRVSSHKVTPTKPRPKHKSSPRSMVPSSITFNWRRCKDIPQHMNVGGLPVAHNGKLYLSDESKRNMTVLEYTPGVDHWDELPPPPVYHFTITKLNNKLALVGGKDKSTHTVTNTIFTFDDRSREWTQSNRALPTARSLPAVVSYQDHLIIVGGRNSERSRIPEVNILDTTSDKWITAEPLPTTDDYMSVLIEETMYLVGQLTRQVLQAHVPTLISQAKSAVWESIPITLFYRSSPTVIDRLLLTVGGSDNSAYLKTTPTTIIQLFNTSSKQWSRVGDLPEPICSCHCIELSGQLFVLGGGTLHSPIKSVYTAEVVSNY